MGDLFGKQARCFSLPRLRCHPRQTKRSVVQIGDLPLAERPKPQRSPLFVTLRCTAAGMTTMKVELALGPLVVLKKVALERFW